MNDIAPKQSTAAEINREHAACLAAASDALEHAMRCGDLLAEAKAGCEHGQWEQWLADNFAGSARTARAYMQLAEHREQIESKRQRSATLSIDGALKLLAPPPTAVVVEPDDGWIDGQELFGVLFPPGLRCLYNREGRELTIDFGDGTKARFHVRLEIEGNLTLTNYKLLFGIIKHASVLELGTDSESFARWCIGDLANYGEKYKLALTLPAADKCVLREAMASPNGIKFIDAQRMFGPSFPSGVQVAVGRVEGSRKPAYQKFIGRFCMVLKFADSEAELIGVYPNDEGGEVEVVQLGEFSTANRDMLASVIRFFPSPPITEAAA